MSAIIPEDILAKFQAKYDWLKREQFTVIGDPDADGIHQIADGIWTCHYGNTANPQWYGCTIVVRAGDAETREVHGKICERWLQEGGALGWLGLPISDEEVYENDGDPLDRISHFENGDIVCASQTVSTRIVNIRNRSKWYEARRNGLLGLLSEATALDLPERYADELRQTSRKCQEDAFEIALVGEFQGGKSTTFNALCDGRDISPRGNGIKTSATVVTAQNIAGNETKEDLFEWAEVTYKTPTEIALGMSTILRRPLMESESSRQALRQLNDTLSEEEFETALSADDGFPSLVDLGNPNCRRILLEVADDLWSQWEDNHSSLSDDERDELRIATLQLHFYGTDEYQKLLSKTIRSIDGFQTAITFPKDWVIRWANGRHASFTLEEVAFVFIRSVLVRLHSETLRRLGCRITDCPGLFANAYDTSVAQHAIINADAVWYLINGDKQIGQKELEIIRTIAGMGMLGKIETTCNLRGAHEQKIAEILPVTQKSLANAGYRVEVFPYNARLAFLAMQGSLLLDPARKAGFTATDEAKMRIDAKDKTGNASLSAMWVKMVSRLGVLTELEDVENIDDLNAESVAIVQRESLLDGILSRLETEIIPKKSSSILVDKGSARVAKALEDYAGVLLASERAAEAKKEEWNARLAEANNQLKHFVETACTAVSQSPIVQMRDSLARTIALDIVHEALDTQFINALAESAARILAQAEKHFYLTRESWKNALNAQLEPLVGRALKESLVRGIDKWEHGASTKSHRYLCDSLEKACDSIHALWIKGQLNSEQLFKGFDISYSELSNIEALGRELGVQIVWSRTHSLLIFSRTALTFAIEFFFRWKQETIIIDYIKMVRPGLERIASDESFAERLAMPIMDSVRKSLANIEERFIEELAGLEAAFKKERIDPAEKMFAESNEERLRIVEANKAERTGVIEPLRKRIEAFAATVTKELAG